MLVQKIGCQTALLICAIVLVGCADIAKDHEKELQELNTTGTGILIARGILGTGWASGVHIDGTPRCPLEDNTYCIVNVAPGRHEIEFMQGRRIDTDTRNLKPVYLPVYAPANAITYVRIDTRLDFAVRIVVPGLVGTAAKGAFLFSRISKEEFLKMRPSLDRVQSK